VPFSAGKIPEGAIHHFLLPAEGWGCVAGEKEAKELAPEDAKRLADWRRAMRKSPSGKRTVQRLQALAGRTEYLWSLVIERLHISEREISRAIDVWGATDLPHPIEGISRDKVLNDLRAPGTPFWRLKTVMDAWCALWFWPLDRAGLLDGSDPVYAKEPVSRPAPMAPAPAPEMYVSDALWGDEQLVLTADRPATPRKPKIARRATVALTDLEDWLDFAESVLGRQSIPEDSLVSEFQTLQAITEFEDQLEPWMGMDTFAELATRFPWLATVTEITQAQGFFHWELRFAQVFADGGFDIQVGNPPWVRPIWDEAAVLAEMDPWFKLVGNPDEWNTRKRSVVNRAVNYVLGELSQHSGTVEFFSARPNYPSLAGTQPDLYRCFMAIVWRNAGLSGTAGMIHYDTHFVGVREGVLRAATYRHLRVHAHFQNRRLIFPDIDWNKQFGVNIYGSPRAVDFVHISWLFDPSTLTASLVHDGSGSIPGLKYEGEWDLRPHRARIVNVNERVFEEWRSLAESSETPVDQVKLLYPVTSSENSAIEKLANTVNRVGALEPRFSRGYDEAKAKKEDVLRWGLRAPTEWSEVILRGPQFSVGTPFAKDPPHTLHTDKPVDLSRLSPNEVPKTDYHRICERERFLQYQEMWEGRHCTDYYRLAWRVMIPASTERSLFAAIFPPGPTHVDTVNAMWLGNNRSMAIASGFWATLPLDYLLRITARGHLRNAEARAMPVGLTGHPLEGPLLLRALRLNCLTSAYSSLWEELYDIRWCNESWATGIPNPEVLEVGQRRWTMNIPLRSEFARRAALVELDCIVSVWLGLDCTELTSMYKARFPQLVDYEREMWFDRNGRKLAANFNQWGHGQTKEHWDQLQRHLEDLHRNPPPEGYTPPFYKVDRVAEYRQAHAVFSERLRQATAGESDMR
jgi:hypothetical protein